MVERALGFRMKSELELMSGLGLQLPIARSEVRHSSWGRKEASQEISNDACATNFGSQKVGCQQKGKYTSQKELVDDLLSEQKKTDENVRAFL